MRFSLKLFPAFVIYLLFQVAPFALKPPGAFIYLQKCINHHVCFQRGVGKQQTWIQVSLLSWVIQKSFKYGWHINARC